MLDNTVAQCLQTGHEMGLARLDTQLLMAHALSQPRTWLLAHDDAPLHPSQIAHIHNLFTRRAQGEPLAYLVGEKEFYGLTLSVSPAVLIPRPDTETLVAWALEQLHSSSHPAPRALDLGTGSGAIALAIAHHGANAQVHASDIAPEALQVARKNAQRHGLTVTFHPGSWWQAVGAQRFDLVVSNPPYIAPHDPHLAALSHEPLLALTAQDQGLQAFKDIITTAPTHLTPGSWLLLEHGYNQADQVCDLLRSAGFCGVNTRPDLQGQPRCSGGYIT